VPQRRFRQEARTAQQRAAVWSDNWWPGQLDRQATDWFPLGEWVPLARSCAGAAYRPSVGVEPERTLHACGAARGRQLRVRPSATSSPMVQALAAASRNGGWLLAPPTSIPIRLCFQAQFTRWLSAGDRNSRWAGELANTGPRPGASTVREGAPAACRTGAKAARFKLDVLSGLTPYARQEAPLLALVIVAGRRPPTCCLADRP